MIMNALNLNFMAFSLSDERLNKAAVAVSYLPEAFSKYGIATIKLVRVRNADRRAQIHNLEIRRHLK